MRICRGSKSEIEAQRRLVYSCGSLGQLLTSALLAMYLACWFPLRPRVHIVVRIVEDSVGQTAVSSSDQF